LGTPLAGPKGACGLASKQVVDSGVMNWPMSKTWLGKWLLKAGTRLPRRAAAVTQRERQ
jgi:hypothetical protein